MFEWHNRYETNKALNRLKGNKFSLPKRIMTCMTYFDYEVYTWIRRYMETNKQRNKVNDKEIVCVIQSIACFDQQHNVNVLILHSGNLLQSDKWHPKSFCLLGQPKTLLRNF